ncbi:MAG: PaaI family thioesterase [Candidatus Coatesbacteria bacterium]|nr:MAG: PaaI family thioesterase [Candidatus Coatesbacteria bacterium]
MEVKGDDYCFGCGPANPRGLQLKFDVDAGERRAEAAFRPAAEYQGYAGYTHGGVVAAVLDEAMLKLCWELGIPAVTARLEVELKRPAPVGDEFRVRGWITEERGRIIKLAAEMVDADGAIVASGRSTAVVQGSRR